MCLSVLLLAPFFDAGQSRAEPEDIPGEVISADSPDAVKYGKLRDLIETSLEAETRNLSQLKDQLQSLEKFDKAILTEVNAYEIQFSTHSNLIHLPQVQVKELEKAWNMHSEALKNISTRMEDIRTALEEVVRQQEFSAEQYELNVRQLESVKTELPANPLTEKLVSNMEALIRQLGDKRDILEKKRAIYDHALNSVTAIHQKLTDFLPKFEQALRDKKKEALFTRKKNTAQPFLFNQIDDEIVSTFRQVDAVLVREYKTMARRIGEKGYFPVATFLALIAAVFFLMRKLRNYLLALDEHHHIGEQYPWRHLTLHLLCKSLPLTGLMLFMRLYGHIRDLYAPLPVFQLLCYLLFFWLLSQWAIDFLKLWREKGAPKMPVLLMRRLRILLQVIRYFGLCIVLSHWLIGDSLFLLWLRMAFETTLLIWCVRFWKAFWRPETWQPAGKMPRKGGRMNLFTGLSYTIAVGGMILEAVGFGVFARYWYVSWGITAVSLLWACLTFYLLREWGRKFKAASAATTKGETPATAPLQWFSLHICWLLWIETLFLSLGFAWHLEKPDFIANYVRFLKKPLPTEGLDLSLWSVTWAVIFLLMTQSASRLWRKILLEKLPAGSIDRGLKNSIIIISVYLMWIIGILIALGSIGVDTKSLTVAFGALGIGLGFGLRNIFDNFFSGLILLFERPIQVGDVIEVNNIWGEVKNINVRSTLIQTYDNASLIIPNSDLISRQVTNWSFKDIRIRRNIFVGVAYGTDAELVRQTLMDAAENVEIALKYPKPDVLFTDFGNSALTFRLRVWTDVDSCLAVETGIRFEIDRLFREKNITIPFPQRDLHIRSAVPPPSPGPEEGEV
ncbi:mechanosensitive ion channel domain-containing protein [Desulfonema ishimotonii]|uniref:mechanosensitive ion channel domain-containing protein n=1 Tax=Desulfonema ishimotonii TaxID=45657 RepID=UPI001E589003|nr:mechanosensitive ion channel domain-containing protein [Desulfonema ishimotonii]